ncbi:hypothetical protein [Absidia glauca]|uniref:Ndc10 domain-containing protein n=1 Tax=Absidia glauca TaxID=4829 RepID=A0A163MD50_ABSGL|nr:hypothetical protein [Absidia glauca]
MEQHNDKWRISPTFQENWCDQWQASPHMVDSFILHVPPLTHLPASARSCSRRSPNDKTDWRRKNSVLAILFNLPSLKMHLHRQHSIFSDLAYLSFKRDMLQIEAQEHDPAHTLLQQCVPVHSRFQTPI